MSSPSVNTGPRLDRLPLALLIATVLAIGVEPAGRRHEEVRG